MKVREFNPVDKELVSVRTLAALLDVSPKTIWDWIYKNRKSPSADPIPYHKLGTLVRFDLRKVRGWIHRRKVIRTARFTGDESQIFIK